jgi:hypothetical protein
MSKISEVSDQRADSFVAAVNAAPREILSADEIPEPCLLSQAEHQGWFYWKIVKSTDTDWLPELEARLPYPLPPTLRSLLSRYLFPAFGAGPLGFYAVGVSSAPNLAIAEFKEAIFADRFMSPFLLKRGFIPFARPSDWCYDPVCFDFRNSNRKSEPVVVRVDHEEILCDERLRIIETISPAFHELLEEMTHVLQQKGKTTS